MEMLGEQQARSHGVAWGATATSGQRDAILLPTLRIFQLWLLHHCSQGEIS